MKLLFITRTYPPLVGGMEKFASDFYENYRRKGDIDLIANSGGKKTLPFFLVKVLSFLAINSYKYNLIHFGDAILAPLVPVIRLFSKAKISFTVHGLDVIYNRFGYQKLVIPFLRKADRVVAVSHYTMEQCLIRGIPSEKLIIIPNCVDVDSLSVEKESKTNGQKLLSKFAINLDGKRILITVGRLIKRKGHAWFIKNVFNQLPNDYIYLIAGLGSEYEALNSLIDKMNLNSRVYLLGYVSDSEKIYLYRAANLFIMPNISASGDQEGFGIVALEAGSQGLPVIAADLEGINDAVLDKETGHLIEEKNVNGFLNAIFTSDFDSAKVKDAVKAKFDCKIIAEMYQKEFEKMNI